MAFYPIAEFRPDVADLNVDYTDTIWGVLPADGSYIPCPSLVEATSPVPWFPLGAVSVRGSSGQVFFFFGSNAGLYRLDNTTLGWVNVSRQSGGAYSANWDAPWSFAAFGNFVIAVNANDDPQIFEIGVSTRFRKMGGNPPRAGIVKVWGNFVCLMGLPDNPNRVHWSGLDDAEWWTVGQRSCDYQDFPDGGWVQGSSEETNPLVFLQAAIYKANFVPGSSIVFSFQKIHDRRGAKSRKSIVSRGALSFYIDEGGFYQISSSGEVVGIGFEKVDRSFFASISSSNIENIKGVIDPFHARVYWFVPDEEGEDARIYAYAMVYDWNLMKWSRITARVLDAFPLYMSGYTLEGLDAVSGSLDNLSFSLDSRAWQGGAPSLAAFFVGGRIGYFQGAAMEAIVQTPLMGATNGQMQRIRRIFPIADSGECIVYIGSRNDRGNGMLWREGVRTSPNTGAANRRSRARYHKFQINIPAGEVWSHIKGVDVEFEAAGWR